MKNYILILYSILISCTTPYQSTGFRGGFRDIQIDEDKFIISFQGNGYTQLQDVQGMILLRCAELTLEKGYTHFLIINENNQISHQNIQVPKTSVTKGSAYGTVNRTYSGANIYATGSSTTTTYGGYIIPVSRYGSTLRIQITNTYKTYIPQTGQTIEYLDAEQMYYYLSQEYIK